MPFHCLLFDLDGTLIDSRADLTNSINLTLEELGFPTLPAPQVLSFVGEGVRLLVQRSLRASLEREPEEAQIVAALDVFAAQYRVHLLDQTQLYPEARETLEALSLLPKAIVTNKPIQFTRMILEGLQIDAHFQAILGGDSLPERKPAPLPLLEAARQCGVSVDHCLMVGDTRIDIEAGRAAGMKTCGYVGGFRGTEELTHAGADFLITRLSQLISLIEEK